jgi:hypothetical protein
VEATVEVTVTVEVMAAESTDSPPEVTDFMVVEVMDTTAEASMAITAMDITGAMATTAAGILGSSALVGVTRGMDIGVMGILLIHTMATAMVATAMVMGRRVMITDTATPTVDTATTAATVTRTLAMATTVATVTRTVATALTALAAVGTTMAAMGITADMATRGRPWGTSAAMGTKGGMGITADTATRAATMVITNTITTKLK